jgi:hypothetical protein
MPLTIRSFKCNKNVKSMTVWFELVPLHGYANSKYEQYRNCKSCRRIELETQVLKYLKGLYARAHDVI